MTKGEFKKPALGMQAPTQKAVLKVKDPESRPKTEPTISNMNMMKMISNARSIIIEDITYKNIDGKELKLDVYLPKNKIYQTSPVVVYFHAGAFIGGEKTDNPLEVVYVINRLREEGFTVIAADYRIPDENAKFPALVEDCKDVVRWIRKNYSRYDLDPEKVGLWGLSSGAYLSLLVAFSPDNVFVGLKDLSVYSTKVNFVISWMGACDLVNWNSNQPPVPEMQQLLSFMLGGTVKEALNNYKKASPLAYLTQKAPPVLLLHGNQDEFIPISQSQKLYNAGKKLGLEFHLFPVENVGHGFQEFMRPEANPPFQDVLEMTTTFCKEMLGLG
jgi:acetyl esterase/lipase